MRADVDVAIVGAGPYGLSLATHLRELGVDFRIFGEPMRFWQQLGNGRFLKSFGFATNVYTPGGEHTFVRYSRERSLEESEPCSIADFARYGIWVQEQLVPNLERVDVAHVTKQGRGFAVALTSGETFRCRRVVIAVGLRHFGRIPTALRGLSAPQLRHTAHVDDFTSYAGKEVCVLGAGQSALEVAALLHEAGAKAQIFVRGGTAHFSGKMAKERPWWARLRAPLTGLGPGLKNWALEQFPLALHFTPENVRVPFTKKHLGPSGAWWLRSRLEGKVPIHLRTEVVEAHQVGDRLSLKLRVAGGHEREIEVDRVVVGTGYEIDVDRLAFLDAHLRARVDRVERAPALDRHFQASVRGLYFIGPSSTLSFGPLFRFVAGAAYTAPTLARHLAKGRRTRIFSIKARREGRRGTAA